MDNRHLPMLRLALCLLLALPLAGCSAEARKSRNLSRAEADFAAGRFEAAKIEYMKVLQLGGEDPVAIERLGTIWFEEGAPLRALPFLLKMREKAPANVTARLKLAQTYQAVGSLPETRKEAIAILQQAPNNADALLLLAQTSRTKEEVAEVEQQLQAFPEPHGPAYHLASAILAFQKGDLPAGKSAIDRALALDPKFAAAHLQLGLYYTKQKDFAHAAAEFKTAADLSPLRSAARINLAELKAQTGALPEAIASLQELTKQAPDFLPAWRLQAQYALVQKKPDDALALLENIFSRDSMNLDARILQADAWLAKNETKKAVEGMERLNSTYTKLPTLKYGLARAYLQDKNNPAAITALKDALAMNPDYLEAVILLAELNLRSGDAQSTVALMTEVVKKSPGFGPAQVLLAEGYRMTGRLDEAAALARQLIQQSPKPAPFHLLLGITLRQQNKLAEARESFETVRQLAPDDSAALLQLVDMDVADKKPDAALQRLASQIEKTPASAPLYVAQGRVYASQNDLDHAEASFRKALDVDPSLTDAYEMLIATYRSSNKLDQAIKETEALLAKDPGSPRALMTLGSIYEHQKDFAKARDMYEKLIAAHPDFMPAYNNIAYLYSEYMGQLDKAYDAAMKARNADASSPAVADTLGWILYRRGSYPEAFALLQDSANSTDLSQVAEAQYHLGMAAYMMGQTEIARTALEKAAAALAPFAGKDTIPARLKLLAAGDVPTSDLEAIVKAEPGDLIAQARLGAAYQKAGEADKAAAALEQVAKANPKLLSALTPLAELYAGPLHNPAKALDYAKRANAIAVNDPAVNAVLGRAAFQTGDPGWAYSLLKESAAQRKDDPKILHDLAWAAYGVGNIADARKNMQRVPELAPNTPEAEDAKSFLTLTAAADNPDQAAAALPEAEALLKKDPAYVPALMVKAAAGQPKAAIDSYAAVLKRFPDFAPAQKRLALLYATDPATQAKAADLATKASRMMPDDPELAVTLAQLSYAKKNYAAAVQLLEESAAKKPLTADGIYYLGMSYFQTKNKDQARETLEKAIPAGLQGPKADEVTKTLDLLNKENKK